MLPAKIVRCQRKILADHDGARVEKRWVRGGGRSRLTRAVVASEEVGKIVDEDGAGDDNGENEEEADEGNDPEHVRHTGNLARGEKAAASLKHPRLFPARRFAGARREAAARPWHSRLRRQP